MKRFVVAMLCGAALAACSFASLDYLQDGPATSSSGGPGDVQVDNDTPDGGFDAHVTPLASGQTSPNLLAQDSENIYWISGMDIMTVPKANGAAHSIGQVSGVLELATDSDPAGSVYAMVGSSVIAVKKQGGGQATIYSIEAGAPAPQSIFVDDTSLFVLQVDGSDPTSGKIMKLPKTGGTATALPNAPMFPAQVATLTATDVLWGSLNSDDQTTSAFFDLPKTSPGPASMFTIDDSLSLLTDSRQLAANATTVFWTDGTYLYGRDLQPSSSAIPLYDSPDDDDFAAVAIDSTYLYTLNQFDQSLMRVSLDGKENARLVKGLTLPTSLVVDATSIYVSVGPAAAGQILKIDK